jgi:hypothetical protein
MASISNPNSRVADERQPPQILDIVLATVALAARRGGQEANLLGWSTRPLPIFSPWLSSLPLSQWQQEQSSWALSIAISAGWSFCSP